MSLLTFFLLFSRVSAPLSFAFLFFKIEIDLVSSLGRLPHNQVKCVVSGSSLSCRFYTFFPSHGLMGGHLSFSSSLLLLFFRLMTRRERKREKDRQTETFKGDNYRKERESEAKRGGGEEKRRDAKEGERRNTRDKW